MDWDMSKLLDDVRQDAISKTDVDGDMQEVFETIAAVAQMSKIARGEGLLALEDKYAAIGADEFDEACEAADLLRVGATCVVDGYAPDMIVEMLTNLYWTSRVKGNDALKQYISIRGILMVQEGEHPWAIECMLKSLVPHTAHKKFKVYMEEQREIWRAEQDEKIRKAFESRKHIALSNLLNQMFLEDLEKLILSLEDRALQRVLREIDNFDLCQCMAVFSDTGCEKVFANMSKRLALMLKEDILKVSVRHEDMIEEAMYKVHGIIKRLEDIGEI